MVAVAAAAVFGGASVATTTGVAVVGGGGAVAAGAAVVADLESLGWRWCDHPCNAPVWGSEGSFRGTGAVVGWNGEVRLRPRGTCQLGHGISWQAILGGEQPLEESLITV